MYETDNLVSQYCEAHYGDTYFGVDHFARVCADICLECMKGKPKKRALDLGCAVGRTSFELAREFDFVNGLDFSARFIRIAFQLQEKGYIRYELPEEGEIVSYHEKHLADFGLDGCAHKIEFLQADAANLKPRFTGYDLIFAGNLIDRMVNPAHFLTKIHERLNFQGILVLASPYTWLEQFTKKDQWIGGFRRDGEPYYTLDGLTDILSANFTLVDEPVDIPFIIRETRRKFQHTLAQLTIWQRT